MVDNKKRNNQEDNGQENDENIKGGQASYEREDDMTIDDLEEDEFS